MKFSYIAFILLLAIDLFANEPTYKEAQQSYNAKNFQKSYTLFEELSEKSPENAEYNFLLGRSALELKKYDEALTAFDRVLMLNPSHTRTHMELARLYFETQQFELAQSELDTVLKENLPDNVRDVAIAFKTRINEQMKRHTFGGAFIIGAGYDSNANNDIGRKEFIIPSFNIPIMGNEEVSDSNVFATLVLNHSYDFGDRKGWTLDNSFVTYSKISKEYSNNNLALFSLSMAPTWSEDSYRLSFPITYDRIFLDEKGYLYNLSSGIRGTYMLDATSAIDGGYIYKRGYYDNDESQDSTSNTFAASYKKAFGTNPIMLALNSSYTSTSAINSGRTDIKSSGYSYGAEIAKKFTNGIRTSIGYTGSSTDYEMVDALFGTKRSDTRDEYELGLGYGISNNIMLNTAFSYAKNHSNHDPFNYDKVTVLANAILSF
jgi:tetratricopeptide (TPR) repeat protein